MFIPTYIHSSKAEGLLKKHKSGSNLIMNKKKLMGEKYGLSRVWEEMLIIQPRSYSIYCKLCSAEIAYFEVISSFVVWQFSYSSEMAHFKEQLDAFSGFHIIKMPSQLGHRIH